MFDTLVMAIPCPEVYVPVGEGLALFLPAQAQGLALPSSTEITPCLVIILYFHFVQSLTILC